MGTEPSTEYSLSTAELRARAGAENFPVALRVLPAGYRRDLEAVYAVVRTIDQLGDDALGDRVAQLRDFGADLARVWQGRTAQRAVVRELAATVRRRQLPQEPFQNLVRANLADQQVQRYADYRQLAGYCELSANPIGRIVLGVFGRLGGPDEAELLSSSDRICTGLQLLEHWQDIAEDRRAGRVYLPATTMAEFGLEESELDAASPSPRLRRALEFETDRAVRLLDSGSALLHRLRGWSLLAVAGYLAGGYAAADALRRSRFDPLAGSPRTRARDVLWHVCRTLLPVLLTQAGAQPSTATGDRRLVLEGAW